MQKFSDAALTTCESCGGSLQKIISAPGLMFKGSGWYVTDYSDKLKDPKKAKQDGDKTKKAEPSKPEKKTEKKAETKTQPKPKKDSSSK